MRPLKKVETKRLFERAQQRYPSRVKLAFLLQSLEDPLNVGSMFRVADACGASELVFTGTTPTPPHDNIERTGRGHERRIEWRRIPRLEDALATALGPDRARFGVLQERADAACDRVRIVALGENAALGQLHHLGESLSLIHI